MSSKPIQITNMIILNLRSKNKLNFQWRKTIQNIN